MMDLETENRIASLLLKEAAELRRQADQEGVLAYLKKPSIRARPNSRFLTSTVRGVEQANRAVEVNEMWRLRQKEKELDNRIKCRVRDGNEHANSNMSSSHRRNLSNRHHDVPSSSTNNKHDDRYNRPDEEGLKDDEVEEFLRSRVKRGRGSIGSRMDEMGPYISQSSIPHEDSFVASDYGREERWSRTALGPDRPSWKSKELTDDDDDDDDDESDDDRDKRKKAKKSSSGSSKKQHSKKHKSKEKSRDKKRKKSRHEKRYS